MMRFSAVLVLLCGCGALAPEPEPSSGADGTVPTSCPGDRGAYDAAAADYAATWDLPEAWVAHARAARDSYCLAFEVSRWRRARGAVELSVEACGDDVPDDEGERRTARLSRLVTLAFPGLAFQLQWHGPGSDGTLGVGCATARGSVRGAWTIHDGGAVHELGHFMGLGHHPSAPTWGEEGCAMGLDAEGFDSSCRFAMGLPAFDDGAEDLRAVMWSMYCDECRRELEAAPTACESCPLERQGGG